MSFSIMQGWVFQHIHIWQETIESFSLSHSRHELLGFKAVYFLILSDIMLCKTLKPPIIYYCTVLKNFLKDIQSFFGYLVPFVFFSVKMIPQTLGVLLYMDNSTNFDMISNTTSRLKQWQSLHYALQMAADIHCCTSLLTSSVTDDDLNWEFQIWINHSIRPATTDFQISPCGT